MPPANAPLPGNNLGLFHLEQPWNSLWNTATVCCPSSYIQKTPLFQMFRGNQCLYKYVESYEMPLERYLAIPISVLAYNEGMFPWNTWNNDAIGVPVS